MKARITKPDGSVVELKGTAEEVAEVLRADVAVGEAPPAYIPAPFYPVPQIGTPVDYPGTGTAQPWQWRPGEWTCRPGLTWCDASSDLPSHFNVAYVDDHAGGSQC